MLNLSFTPFPKITTDRLILRAMKSEDLDALFIIRSNPIINKYIGRRNVRSKEDIIRFMARIRQGMVDKTLIFWIITAKTKGHPIGSIVLWNIDAKNNEAEVGYELLPDHHRKGIMTEALKPILQYGFDTIGLHSIIAFTHELNANSLALLRKFSFEQEKRLIDGEEKIVHYLSNTHYSN